MRLSFLRANCAARSDLLNAENGEAEPRLSSGELSDATSGPQAKETVSKVIQKTLTKTPRPKDTNDQDLISFDLCLGVFVSSLLRLSE